MSNTGKEHDYMNNPRLHEARGAARYVTASLQPRFAQIIPELLMSIEIEAGTPMPRGTAIRPQRNPDD